MGYYIETGTLKGKADWIRTNCNEVITVAERSFTLYALDEIKEIRRGYVPVVIVDNGPFETAGIAFDEEELGHFIGNPKDRRPKTLLYVQKDDIERLNPDVKEVLGWD